MKRFNWSLVGLVVLCLIMILLAGCVSKSQYEALQAEQERLKEDYEAIKAQLAEINVLKAFDFKPFAKHPENPILPFGAEGEWDEVDVEGPTTIFMGEDGKFWMYYHAQGVGLSFRIGLAYSDDLITWIREATNPIIDYGPPSAWDERNIGGAVVLKIEGIYHMWYGGLNGDISMGGIGHATSADGKAWVKDARNPLLTDYEIWPTSILLVDGKYWMYTQYRKALGEPYEVRLYFSDDGITWTEYEDNPIFKSTGIPQQMGTVSWLNVVKLGSLWFGAYEAHDMRLPIEGRYHIGLAYSLDGTHWVKHPTFVLAQNKEGWDGGRICLPYLFHWGDKLYLLYTAGVARSPAEQIGLSETKLGKAADKDYFRNADGAWRDKGISAGESTYGIPTFGYERITLEFISDTIGTLTIETQEPDGSWQTFTTRSITANQLEEVVQTGTHLGIRLRFDANATVTAWYVLL